MRIVIDMQGAQTESRFRGIGRYTMAFSKAIVGNRGEHEIFLALNGLFPETIEPIRAAFDGLLPQENIRIWRSVGPFSAFRTENNTRRLVAETVREAFLASLQPDVLHVSSIFEGYIDIDNAATSFGRFDKQMAVSVMLYDLIPLLNPKQYLDPNPQFSLWYREKLVDLENASLCLAISDYARQEGIENLDIAPDRIVNISAANMLSTGLRIIDADRIAQLRQKFGLKVSFLLYSGGGDQRKNLPRLVDAYAALPERYRDKYQLVMAGQINEADALKTIGRLAGIRPDQIVFTGHIQDEELIDLYNLCSLFVFPSWHEGFGLPALEAMSCGAPVIAANTSSLPDVVGLNDALFDPFDTAAISSKIRQVLDDDVFCQRLREHGLQQSKKFSWNKTACRAIRAWEKLAYSTQPQTKRFYGETTYAFDRLMADLATHLGKSDDAEIVHLSACMALNQAAGIERQLLLDVSELCQRDAATGVQRVVRSYLKWLLQSPPAGYRVEPIFATQAEGYRYARGFTQRFLGMPAAQVSDGAIRWQRGDMFFGLDMQHHVQLAHRKFYRQLQREGVVVKFLVYDLLPIQLAGLFKDSDAKELHERWLTMIAATDGAVCISQATADAFEDWVAEQGVSRAPTLHTSWVHIGADIDASKPSTGLPDDATSVLEVLRKRPTFLCVSTLEPRKRQEQILDAVELLWKTGTDVNLVLVGQQGWQTQALGVRLRAHPESGRRLFWLQGISDEYLEKVYAVSSCLIAASLNEGFGLSLIEAARHGVPIIARDIPVFREVAGDCAFYFQGEAANDLANALGAWLEKYRTCQHPPSSGIPWLTWQQSTEMLKVALVGQHCPRRQLLVDISELVQSDAGTGIQRVTKNVLWEWLKNPPENYRVEPVYATLDDGYKYAKEFTCNFLGLNDEVPGDSPIDYAPGDIFFGLDLCHHTTRVHANYLRHLHEFGLRMLFLVHDLLPIKYPHFWPLQHQVHKVHEEWLDVITRFDGAVCVSKAVADDLAQWINNNRPGPHRPFSIDYSHNAADIQISISTKVLPDNAESVLGYLNVSPSFLMVGTLEARKGHLQVLNAFEILWKEGSEVILVIVGKEGWLVDDLVTRLRSHPEVGRHLFWLEGISDEYLDKVYGACTCLIAASYDEGFGLPLIEAAQHKLPIIARDIPVFREVAAEHAYYFEAPTADGFALSIKNWLTLYHQGKHPKSNDMPWLTWNESARRLRDIVLGTATSKQETHS